MAQQSTEYGKRQGHGDNVFAVPVAASEVFKKQGGNFVTIDTNGRAAIATAAATNISGHALISENFTASSTAGGTIVPVDFSLDSIYEIPISGNWADAMVGKTCDLIITSSIQYANVAASSTDVIEILGKGTTNAAGTVVSLLCRIYAKNQALTGVV